jgi:hypothetical protein
LANLEPDRGQLEFNTKLNVKTIKGISNLFYWKWPVSGEMLGYIRARSLSHFGSWNDFSPAAIAKLCNNPIIRPHPKISEQTESESAWTISIPTLPGINIYIF